MDESRSLHQRVLELAEAMAQPEERERPLLEALCTAAEADAAGRLRDDLTPESCGFAYLCDAGGSGAAALPGGRRYRAVYRRGCLHPHRQRRVRGRRGPAAAGGGADGRVLAGRRLRLCGGPGMKRAFDRMRIRYGQEVALTPRQGGETVRVRAFLQPVLRQREEGGAAVTPLGGVSRERWLYLGPGETALQLGDRADCGDLALAVQQARQVFWGDAPVYWWATLRRRKEEGHEQCH